MLDPLTTWLDMKKKLRRQIGKREWELWLQHLRLWKVSTLGGTMAIQVPRQGKVTFGALRYYSRLRSMAAEHNFGLMLLMAPDWEVRQLLKESIEAMDNDDPRRLPMLRQFADAQQSLLQPYLEDPPSPLWRASA